MMRTKYVTLLITCIVLAGCDVISSSNEMGFSSFSIETDAQTYASDQEVNITFKNNTRHSVWYHPCFDLLQRLDNAVWEDFDGMGCVGQVQPVVIKAGESYSTRLIWFGNDYEAGDYRAVFQIGKDEEKLPFENRITGKFTIVE